MKALSTIITSLFIFLIGFIWYAQHSQYQPNKNELINKQVVNTHLKTFASKQKSLEKLNVKYIPTGLYIQSLKFKTANDVYVSGLVWQQYDENQINDNIGVRFPNAVEHFIIEESYREIKKDKIVVGWYFEANLRQDFNYDDYPLDHKTVWIKLLPKDFNSKDILVPALDSYEDTSLKASFGIDQDIVLGGWDVDESFFDYVSTKRDTQLGLNNQQKSVPQLTFNIVIKRQFISAFMINITLMLVSMSLLFSFIIMMTNDEKLKPIYGLKLPSTISASAGIFLALLVAHISIREKFQGSGFIYIEYFYIIAYIYIISTIMANYFFVTKDQENQHKIFAKDSIYLKHLYWPVYFGLLALFSLIHFYF